MLNFILKCNPNKEWAKKGTIENNIKITNQVENYQNTCTERKL